jgi:hypothetical protein
MGWWGARVGVGVGVRRGGRKEREGGEGGEKGGGGGGGGEGKEGEGEGVDEMG